MDVDKSQFWDLLPTILKHIANADFIAIDLELSGIPQRSRLGRSLSLADYYLLLKGAAADFHILQVGMTCVEKGEGPNEYLCRPFNFTLSPLVDTTTGVPPIERKFSYSSGAVEFLLSHGYQMDAPFLRGIPYLAKDEEQEFRQRAAQRWDRDAIPDIVIPDNDSPALALVQRMRTETTAWAQKKNSGSESLTITGPNLAPLSRFEKRLVHQTVRSEYPALDSTSTRDSVTIRFRSASSARQHKQSVQTRITTASTKMIGFRWVADAIGGKDLSQLDPALCVQRIEGEPSVNNSKRFSARLEELKSQISSSRRPLVGHNCFIDLVYFYKTFYGPLPDSLEAFKDLIGRVLPIVIDTKYMATSSGIGRTRQDSQLWQLEAGPTNREDLNIRTPVGYSQYSTSGGFHEAGFDSLVTARVCLQLAGQLFVKGNTGKDGEEFASVENAKPIGETGEVEMGPVAVQVRRSQSSKNPNGVIRQFSHANPFEILNLSDETNEPKFEPDKTRIELSHSFGTFSDLESRPIEIENSHPSYRATGSQEVAIPEWDSPFWAAYVNKLRVYGAMEENLDLGCPIG